MLMKDHPEQPWQIFSCHTFQIHLNNKYLSMYVKHDLTHMKSSQWHISLENLVWQLQFVYSLMIAVCLLMFMAIVSFPKSGNSLCNVYNSPVGLRHSRNYMKSLLGICNMALLETYKSIFIYSYCFEPSARDYGFITLHTLMKN